MSNHLDGKVDGAGDTSAKEFSKGCSRRPTLWERANEWFCRVDGKGRDRKGSKHRKSDHRGQPAITQNQPSPKLPAAAEGRRSLPQTATLKPGTPRRKRNR